MAGKVVYWSVLSTRAHKEIMHSWNWYEDRQKGLGDQFVMEMVDKILSIEQAPELYPCKYKTYREARIATFPFLIIYKVNKSKRCIRVVSIFHTSRNPKMKY